MSTELGSAGNARFSGPQSINYTSVEEANNGQVADGQKAVDGAKPVVVERGDTISDIMAKYGLDWNNPADRKAFLEANPQFKDRNPDLIYPGEVLYVPPKPGDGSGRTPDGSPDVDNDGKPDPATDTDHNGRPDPVNSTQAQATTDAAASDVDKAQKAYDDYMKGPGPKGLRHEYQEQIDNAKKKLFNAIQAEIEVGLREFQQQHPNATPEQITAEANRLRHEIQSPSGDLASIDDTSMDYRTQAAINNVSAEGLEPPIDLDRVQPGTTVRDGPYTPTHGPFEPNTNITLKDGTTVGIDKNGYPSSTSAGALAPSPATPKAVQDATTSAAQAYQRALDLPHQLADAEEIQQNARRNLTNAIQREVEAKLQTWLDAHPGASDDEIKTQATAIATEIQKREGANVVSESTVSTAAANAANSVIANRYN